MIRHIVLFRFRPGYSWESPQAVDAERSSRRLGDIVPELHEWYVGRNVSSRPIAYDFVVMGLLSDGPALQRYLEHPVHRESAEKWRRISDWVIADVVEDQASKFTRADQR